MLPTYRLIESDYSGTSAYEHLPLRIFSLKMYILQEICIGIQTIQAYERTECRLTSGCRSELPTEASLQILAVSKE